MGLISKEAALAAIDHEREMLIEQRLLGAEHVVVHHARRLIEDMQTVPAVPLEPLAKWIAENLDPRCGCSYCSRDRVCCDCPTMTEQQVKEELTKWMEEQRESV